MTPFDRHPTASSVETVTSDIENHVQTELGITFLVECQLLGTSRSTKTDLDDNITKTI
jgi:hypothetical protein